MSSSPSTVLNLLQERIQLAKRRYIRRLSLRMSCIVTAVGGVCFAVSGSWWLSATLGLLTLLLCLLIAVPQSALKKLHLNNVLLHLNQQFTVLQHSAQLLVQPAQGDSLLKTLQRERTERALQSLLDDPHVQVLPDYPWQRAAIANLVMIALVLGIVYFNPTTELPSGEVVQTDNKPPLPPQKNAIESAQVSITPPAYTKLPVVQQTSLDIAAVAGSMVTWKLTFSEHQQSYFLQLAGQPDIALIKQEHAFTVTLPIERASVYHIKSEQGIIGSIHSIAVTADNAPQIRITEPTSTISVFAKQDQPTPVLSAQISDDFGISKVDILASVAKGSGEAVKFRDEIFEFDTVERGDTVWHAEKLWGFSQLDMEPGDELYFTVRVWDNRTPEPQLSRSETKILRWLDDEEALAVGDGILLDFMPEYFKSQRQIIIETKQLIADRDILSESDFTATSRSLGHSQSDLKLKYGQYLGDEFDDGSGATQMEDDVGTPHVDVKDGDHNDEHEHDDSAQVAAGDHSLTNHEHEVATESEDKSGYQQIIDEFGHAHGDTDIGVMGTLSPKALMKRAIAFMWDAELQLLLAKPEQALPYEEKALTFLNRARKAERIYIKRLGFEPPPVSEKRRYQGDLSDILSYKRYRDADPDDPYNSHLTHLLTAFNRARQAINTGIQTKSELNKDMLASIEFLKPAFIEQAQTRPAMVSHVATLEKMQLADRLWLSDCDDCMRQLYNELWRQLTPVAIPGQSNSEYRTANPMVEAYSKYLLNSAGEQP
ncbi:DUF4175 domain-containing protein [Alteromonas sp. ZYF713]|nr:DUF4175 domain-containing protein [Alteromonas sp. ZYF713]